MKGEDYIYVSLMVMGEEKMEESEILQRRRLPFPNGKDHKLKFTNHTDDGNFIIAIGYFEEQDSDHIFEYSLIDNGYFLSPDDTLIVRVENQLVEYLYNLKNEK